MQMGHGWNSYYIKLIDLTRELLIDRTSYSQRDDQQRDVVENIIGWIDYFLPQHLVCDRHHPWGKT